MKTIATTPSVVVASASPRLGSGQNCNREGAGGAGRLGRRSRLLLAALVSLAAVLLMAPAANAEVPFEPTLDYPIQRTVGTEVVVQVNAGPKTWRIRKAARMMDALVDGLTIRTSGDCATANVCVNVHVDNYDEGEMLAITHGQLSYALGVTVHTDPAIRDIYLNTFGAVVRDSRTMAAAHELAHVLGLDHHASPGLMSVTPGKATMTLSEDELGLLRSWYSTN